jgi:hypothetical protein
LLNTRPVWCGALVEDGKELNAKQLILNTNPEKLIAYIIVTRSLPLWKLSSRL